MPEFDETIMKLEMWWRYLFPTDAQIQKYMDDVARLEEIYGGIYTMESLYADLDLLILKLLEIDYNREKE